MGALRPWHVAVFGLVCFVAVLVLAVVGAVLWASNRSRGRGGPSGRG